MPRRPNNSLKWTGTRVKSIACRRGRRQQCPRPVGASAERPVHLARRRYPDPDFFGPNHSQGEEDPSSPYNLSRSRRRIALQAKQTVREVLDRLPDDCSLDDVLYHLYVANAVSRGQAEAAAGQTVSHDDVARELRKKWLIGASG